MAHSGYRNLHNHVFYWRWMLVAESVSQPSTQILFVFNFMFLEGKKFGRAEGEAEATKANDRRGSIVAQS